MRRGRATLAMVVAVVALAGCADDSDSGSDTESAEPPEATVPEASVPAKSISVAGARRSDLADRAIAELSIKQADWMTLAAGSLWVKRVTEVDRVDPDTHRVVDTVAPGGGFRPFCQGLASTGDSLWSCPRGGVLQRIDPRSNAVAETFEIDKLPDEGRMVSAAGKLWLLTGDGDILTGIDARTGEPVASVALNAECLDLAGDDQSIWVLCEQDDRLLHVDPRSAEVIDQLGLAGPRTGALSDQLWVGFEGGVAQIDPDSLKVVAVYDLYPRYGGAIHATPDAAWVREDEDRFLSSIDPASKTIDETILAPDLAQSPGDVIVIGDEVWATASEDHTLVAISVGP